MGENSRLTLYEDDFNADDNVREDVVQLVVFRVSGEWYAVEMKSVREVVTFDRITFLPSSPEHVAGIFNLRGNILSVTDMKRIFGLSSSEITEKSRLVVIESGVCETGLLVDEVDEPVDVAVSKIVLPLATIAPERAEYLSGTYNLGKKFIGILRPERILQVKK
ncbi:MAG: purine-binding chemotaxis protein CheW [Candidatus Omnitrophica bacterium]|nr:purine-binding chemotaxis protein CheW [Candidatus Omnitrophota bacterium]